MPNRAETARATRRRMLDAATALFLDHGVAGTSVKRIAGAAGVGEQTVCFTFGTKVNVLAEVLDVAVAGEDDPVPTLERAWAQEVLAEPDPGRFGSRGRRRASRPRTGRGVATALLSDRTWDHLVGGGWTVPERGEFLSAALAADLLGNSG